MANDMSSNVDYFAIYHDKDLGLYSDYTPVHHTVVKEAMPFIKDALEYIPFVGDKGGPFHVVDYGTGDGGTTIDLMHYAIDYIKMRYGKGQEVLISYEDQPHNDFQAIVKKIYGGLYRSNGRIYDIQNGHENHQEDTQHQSAAFVSLRPISFYRQCFPSDSVQLGVSFTAMQWLEKSPCALPNSLVWASSNNEEEIFAYVNKARQDWETILLHRSRELCNGGRLVIAIPGVANETFKDTPLYKYCFRKMEMIWTELYQDGVIEKNEFEDTSFRCYIRTDVELAAPFEDKASPVYQSGLKLISTDAKRMNTVFKWTQDKTTDLKAHAKRLVVSVRAFANSSLLQSLSNERTDEEKSAILDDFFTRYERDVERNPSEHDTPFDIMYVYIRKDAL